MLLKWFLNLKIRTKFLLSFLIVALFIVMVGFVGVKSTMNMDSSIKNIYNEKLLPIVYISKIQKNIVSIRANCAEVLNNSFSQDTVSQDIMTMFNENNKTFNKFKDSELSTNENVKKLLKEYNDTIGEYENEVNKYLILIQELKTSDANMALQNLDTNREKIEGV